MPLWHIYCPEGTYSAEDKRALADRITDLYAEYGLPRFLVSVVFQEVPKDSYLIGGEPADDYVRIWIDQIARRIPDDARGWSTGASRQPRAPRKSSDGPARTGHRCRQKPEARDEHRRARSRRELTVTVQAIRSR